MHWWQIVIRLLLIANCLGNVSDILRAGRNHQWERLHWLAPNAIGWAALVFALLPARCGGIGKSSWESIAYGSLILLGYGLIIKMTDASFPFSPWMSIEVPHFGNLGLQHMLVIPIFGFVFVGWDILQHRRVTSKDELLLSGFSVGLIFGVRLIQRQVSLTRLSDLIELMKPKPRLPKKQPEKY